MCRQKRFSYLCRARSDEAHPGAHSCLASWAGCMGAGITQFTHHGIIFVPLGYTEPNGLQYNLVRFLPCAPSCARFCRPRVHRAHGTATCHVRSSSSSQDSQGCCSWCGKRKWCNFPQQWWGGRAAAGINGGMLTCRAWCQPGDVPVVQEVPQGGSAYGAGTLAGPKGERQPTKDELAIAKHQARPYLPSSRAARWPWLTDCVWRDLLHPSAPVLCLRD